MAAMITGLAAYAQCSASLTAVQTPPSGNTLLNVNFTNSSSYGSPFTGQIKKYFINFGDGTILLRYAPTVSHIYAAPGTYTVGLRIYSFDTSTNTNVCTDTTTISVVVTYPACGTVISASGSGASQSFTASNPAATSGISYSWNFGDGSTGSGSSVGHTYAYGGTYTVTCTSSAGSPASCSYVNTMSLLIIAPPPPLVCSTLSANFTATVGSGGSNVGISNTSTIAGVGWQYWHTAYWDFGDGTTSIDYYITPKSHVYAATGTYNIKLVMVWEDSFKTTICRDSITKSVTISSISPVSINGGIHYNTTIYGTPPFKVWLIQFNPATNILSAVDSQIATVISGYLSYNFTNKPAGQYLVKTAVQGGPTSGTGLMPTYADSTTTWSTARTINAVPASNNYVPIFICIGTLTAGPGFVAGNVSLGANKGSAGGVEGMLIFLRNTANTTVQMTTTDANGDYSFTNVPGGIYNVYPEQLNYATTPAPITVGSGSTPVTGVNFHQDDVKMNIKPLSLGLTNLPGTVSQWSVYPNPASGTLNVSWKAANGISGIIIIDIAGRTVLQSPLPDLTNGTHAVDISTLRPGLYFVHGAGTLRGAVQKLVIE